MTQARRHAAGPRDLTVSHEHIIRSREAELCGRRPHDKEVLKNEKPFGPPTLQDHSLGPPTWPGQHEPMRVRPRGLWLNACA